MILENKRCRRIRLQINCCLGWCGYNFKHTPRMQVCSEHACQRSSVKSDTLWNSADYSAEHPVSIEELSGTSLSNMNWHSIVIKLSSWLS